VAALLLRAYVCDIYGVTKHSMEPTLHAAGGGSDKVAVFKLAYLLDGPDRWDLCVFRRGGKGHYVVKRVVGLPGEYIQVDREGDLLVGPSPTRLRLLRKSPAELARLLVPLADLDRVPPTFPRDGQWAFDPACWRWEKGSLVGLPPPGGVARFAFKGMPHQGYLGPEGVVRQGGRDVRDFGLQFRCRPRGPESGLRVVLTALDREFTLTLHRGILTVTADGRPVRRVESPALARGGEAAIRFVQADRRLHLWVEGKAFTNDLDPWPPLPEGLDLVPRRSSLVLEVKGGGLELAGLRVVRDLHYCDHTGTHATAGGPEPLGEGEYFMLGDNSAMSEDSRHYGGVPSAWFVGSPLCVILPLDRIRWL
jgi:signal peptidase I